MYTQDKRMTGNYINARNRREQENHSDPRKEENPPFEETPKPHTVDSADDNFKESNSE